MLSYPVICCRDMSNVILLLFNGAQKVTRSDLKLYYSVVFYDKSGYLGAKITLLQLLLLTVSQQCDELTFRHVLVEAGQDHLFQASLVQLFVSEQGLTAVFTYIQTNCANTERPLVLKQISQMLWV